ARYQGLGGGPNTAMMVLAVAFPLSAFVGVALRRPGARVVAAAVTALLLGSIVASGSRGALVGAFAGLFVFALLAQRSVRRRLLVGAGILVLFVVCVLVTRIPQPSLSAPPLPSAGQAPPVVFHGPRKAVSEPPPRLQDDVGRPPYGVGATTKKLRTLFGSSGRARSQAVSSSRRFSRISTRSGTMRRLRSGSALSCSPHSLRSRCRGRGSPLQGVRRSSRSPCSACSSARIGAGLSPP